VCLYKNIKIMKKNILVILIILTCLFVSTSPAQAKRVFDEIIDNVKTFNTGAQLPEGSGDILPIIIGLVNILLGFLALLFIIMILYAGFLYLTAGGVPDKAKKAMGIIKDSVIGVAIVVLAGVFVNYILEKLIDVVR